VIISCASLTYFRYDYKCYEFLFSVVGFLCLFAFAAVGEAFSTNNYFTQVDHARFLSLFKGAQPYGSNVEMTYYSVMGYSLLEEAVPEAAVCHT